ncbi:MAG: alpha/beta hydrolase [Bacteriovoracia bacterium]
MTNSYNSPLVPKIVFFHGLNNNPECFGPLIKHFENQGHETELVILPCHGEDRKEARNAKEAIRIFDRKMKELKEVPYVAIGFSHGALYLQLWLEQNQEHKPLKQVLLAPALYIRRQKLIEKALKILPASFIIKSLSPKPFRRYEILSAWEYNILVQGMLTYQKIRGAFRIPSMVLIDPKDELVDASKLKRELEKNNPKFTVHFLERSYLKKGLGSHHILFHPDYFNEKDWKSFLHKLESFLLDR